MLARFQGLVSTAYKLPNKSERARWNTTEWKTDSGQSEVTVNVTCLLASAAIPERLAIEPQEPAHPPLTEPKALGAPLSRRSLRLGPYQFFALIAFSA